MNRRVKNVISVVTAIAMVICLVGFYPVKASNVEAADDLVTLNVSTEVNVIVKDVLIDKINEIRKEFEKDNNEHHYVKSYTYTPIKWSTDMEEIAFIRAVEGSCYWGHTRPNGKSCFTVTSSTGRSSQGEIMASASNGLSAIYGWYSEKEDFYKMMDYENGVSDDDSYGETGHYAQLIFSNYIGIATYGVTVGETDSKPGYSDKQVCESGNIEAKVEIKKSNVNAFLMPADGHSYSTSTKEFKMAKGQSLPFKAILFGGWSTVTLEGTWSSGNSSIASCDKNGNVKALKSGKVDLTFEAGGLTESTSVLVKEIVKANTPNQSRLYYDEMFQPEWYIPYSIDVTWDDGEVTKQSVEWDTKSYTVNDLDDNSILRINGKLMDYPEYQVTATYLVIDRSGNPYKNGASDKGGSGDSGSGSSDKGGSSGSGKGEWRDGKYYNPDGSQTYGGILSWKANANGWWVEDSLGWYPVSSWQIIDGKWYYFNSSGYMAANEWVDGCWLSSSGAWEYDGIGSWKSDSYGWWFEDTSGWWAASCWQKIDGYWYYFDGSGYMVTNTYIDGYWIGSDGVCW